MACTSWAYIQGSTAFRANALGRSSAQRPRACCPVFSAPAACEPDCLTDGGFARVKQYESQCVPAFAAYPNDGLAGQPVRTILITRSAPANGAVFSVGTGLSDATGDIEGFLLRTQAAKGAPSCDAPAGSMTQHATLLRTTASDGTVYRLNQPKAVLLEARRVERADCTLGVCSVVVVVGSGEIVTDSGTTQGPAIATIQYTGAVPECNPVPYITVGNGGTDVTDETYEDVMPDPFTRNAWLVCSTASVSGGDPTALVRRIDVTTRLPQIVGGPSSTLTYTEIDFSGGGVAPAASASAVSLTATSTMVVVAVHTDDTQSLLWPLRGTDLTQILPWVATNFNDGTTNRLRLATNAASVLALRVMANLSDEVYVATLTAFDTAASLPVHGTQAFKFTASTDPDLDYGVSGVSTWFDAEAGSTRPNDARLVDDRNVLVVGNAFMAEADPAVPPTYDVPGFPYLDVTVPAAELPVPFMVEFKDGCGATSPGASSLLLRGLDGCAMMHWASTFAQYCAGAGLLLGDVTFHFGCPAQPGNVLAVNATLKCPARVLNAARVPVPVVQTCCSGVVCVDALCAPTVLHAKGPVVVGCDEGVTPLPGMIRFNPDSATFEGYNGSAWETFTMAP